jgi:hypothetical protein
MARSLQKWFVRISAISFHSHRSGISTPSGNYGASTSRDEHRALSAHRAHNDHNSRVGGKVNELKLSHANRLLFLGCTPCDFGAAAARVSRSGCVWTSCLWRRGAARSEILIHRLWVHCSTALRTDLRLVVSARVEACICHMQPLRCGHLRVVEPG